MARQVVILLHNAIEAMGMQRIILDAFGITAHLTGDIEELQQLPADAIDLVVTDAQFFLENLKMFLPRKARTLVVVNQPVESVSDVHLVNVNQDTHAIVDALSRFLGENEDTSGPSVLSSREIDVLRLVASGIINKQIADTLNISINTVLTHRKNITAKLGIKSVSGLTFYAMMNGIIAPK